MGWLERVMQALHTSSASLAGACCSKRSAARRPLWAFELLEPRLTLAAAGLVPVGRQPTGPLTGKIVYTSAGHGWQYLGGGWSTDRENVNSMIEPFGSQDQLTYFADYLLRAGATVVPMRPIGRQVNEIVLDNDSPGVTYSGSWTDSTAGTRWYDEDYGAVADSVRYRFANSSDRRDGDGHVHAQYFASRLLPRLCLGVARGESHVAALRDQPHRWAD